MSVLIRKVILLLVFLPLISSAETISNDMCFNFYIVTKKTNNLTESDIFKSQEQSLLNQAQRVVEVFKQNQDQQCPSIVLNKGRTKQISWQEAEQYSRPLEQGINEPDESYRERKKQDLQQAILKIENQIDKKEKEYKHKFFTLRPGRVMLEAERLYNNDSMTEELKTALNKIQNKMSEYDPEGEHINREKNMREKYEAIDNASAEKWRNGVLTLWNDTQAQDISIEVKNLLRFNRTPENECIDVYSVPDGYSPSRNSNEITENGEWSQRGGAALSAKLFPRTTNGKHAIILTQNITSKENRLAHELGHIYIDVNDAHFGKEPKDLMYEKSMGGGYLSEEECQKINETLNSKPTAF